MEIRSYQDLNVWQLGMDMAAGVYQMTRHFPSHERYGLGSQLERAAVSIPANIAEGHAKESTKQFLFHLSVAMGSVAESETHLLLAERLGYSSQENIAGLMELCNRIGRMLHNLQRSLRSKLEPS